MSTTILKSTGSLASDYSSFDEKPGHSVLSGLKENDILYLTCAARLAQLVRALLSHSRGQWFESIIGHTFNLFLFVIAAIDCGDFDSTHVAWSFYYDHKAEIDRRLADESVAAS
jgi:hypothetical protein